MDKKLKLFFIFLFLLMSIIPTSLIKATTTDEESLKQIENVKDPGSYPVKVYYDKDGKELEKIVYMLVTGDNTKVGTNGIAIDASPLAASISDVSEFTKSDWIREGKAKAWDTQNGEIQQILVVDTSQVQEAVGSYPVTYTTFGEVQTTVEVKVTDSLTKVEKMFLKNQQDGVDKQQNEQLLWRNFSWFQKISLTLLFLVLVLLPIIVLITQYRYAMKLIKEVLETLRNKEV